MIKKAVFLLVSLFLVFSLIGCATRVSYKRMKPSTIDMSDSRNIAIFHIDELQRDPAIKTFSLWELLMYMSGDDEHVSDTTERRVAKYATNLLTESLVDTDYFQIIQPESVSSMINVQNLGGLTQSEIGEMLGVDAVFIGTISQMDYEDTPYTKTMSEINSDGLKVVVEVDYIQREFYFSMGYRILKTDNDRVLVSRIYEKNSSDSELAVDFENLRDPEMEFRSMIRDIVFTIKREVAPYAVWENRRLSKDKRDNPKMETANEYVKNNHYDKALPLYLEVWEQTNNEAAGINASIIYELKSNLNKACDSMVSVISFYPNRKNSRRLIELESIRKEQVRVDKQF